MRRVATGEQLEKGAREEMVATAEAQQVVRIPVGVGQTVKRVLMAEPAAAVHPVVAVMLALLLGM